MQADEVIIIGAGPAGVTAAIQLKRYGIPFVLLEKEQVGGLLWNANLVENYPGFPAGVSGPKLIGLIEKQMERIGIEVKFDSVANLSYENGHFQVKTASTAYYPRYVIVATGTTPKPYPIPVPKEVWNRVFSDVYHLLNVHEKRIIIVGAGDAAFDYALNLVKKRNFVTILNRSGEVKCLRLLWERVNAEGMIVYRAETPVRAVVAEETMNRLEVRLDADESITADYLIFAIGRAPQMDFISDTLMDKDVKDLYFIGDVKNGLYRQAAIAAGDGLRAAMDIYFKLEA
jgi:thioredoxin reductase